MNAIISKEEFSVIMKQIEIQREKVEKFSDALEEMSDGHIIFDSDNQYFNALMFLLNKVFSQKEDKYGTTIDWFLFEGTGKNNDTHEISFEGYKVNIDSYEKLYDLLITEKVYNETGDIKPTRDFFTKYGTKESER